MKHVRPAQVVLGLLVMVQSAVAGGPGTTRGIIDIGKPERPADAVTLVGPDGYDFIPEGAAPTKWVFADGILTASPAWDSVVTKESYRDFRMHVEFNVNEVKDAKDPEANGNSGIYIQNRYEIQIHNSFSVSEADYKASYCGSIYRRKKPDRLVCKPAGEWQDFDIAVKEMREFPEANPYPGETCWALEQGWFWKEGAQPKPAKQIVELLNRANRRHSNFLLNVGPNKQGRFEEASVKVLAEIGKVWRPNVAQPEQHGQ